MQTQSPSSGEPARYVQLVSRFREDILAGTMPPGTRLPTEHDLATTYRISRGTVRQAMSVLVNEGLVERVQGRGSFVRQAPTPQPQPPERRIGLVLVRQGGQLELDILLGVEQVARARGYQVTFTYTNDRAEQLADDIERLRADRAAGFIICLDNDVPRDEAIMRLRREGTPVVLVDRYCSEVPTDYVTADNVAGGFRATEHLIILGHVRIGFIYTSQGTLTTTSIRDRHLGYRKALETYGIPYDESLVFCCPYPHTPPVDAPVELDTFLRRDDRPSSVFAVHDQVALHLLQAARRCGIAVPEELALVGFDDLSYAEHLTPPLTTLAQPRAAIGQRAGQLLLDRIEGLQEPLQQIELPVTLRVRESCGARLRVRHALETAGTHE